MLTRTVLAVQKLPGQLLDAEATYLSTDLQSRNFSHLYTVKI